MINTRLWPLVWVVAILFVLASCSGEQQGDAGGGEDPEPVDLVPREDIRLVMVTHGTAADEFHTVVRNGLEAAAEDLGVEVEYLAPDTYDVAEIRSNLESAIASEPDGMIVTIADPEALTDDVREAVDQGIPVVVTNAGRDVWEEAGALAYVGQAEAAAGIEAGERMSAEGVTNALCVNQQPGVTTLDQRCQGFAAGLGSRGVVEEFAVDGGDPEAVRNGVEEALRQNPQVDGVLTLGPQGSDPTLQVLEDLDRDIVFATFDLSPSVLEAIQEGEMLFAVDQQPFLQGYLPVVFLTQYLQYGTRPLGEIKTGPTFVTQRNAEQVIELSEQGIR